MLSYESKNHKEANVEAVVVTKPEGSYQLKERTFGSNLVTDLGDKHYTQSGAGRTVTNDLAGANGRIDLRNQTDTPPKTDKLIEVLGVQAPVQQMSTCHTQ